MMGSHFLDKKTLFRTKTIPGLMECCQGEHTLKKVLGPLELVFFGVGAIIGTGIFVITGIAAAIYAGPAIAVSFIGTAATLSSQRWSRLQAAPAPAASHPSARSGHG